MPSFIMKPHNTVRREKADRPKDRLAFVFPPRDTAELFDRLVLHKSEGAPSLAAVAGYAIDQPLEVAFGTVRRVALASGVSTASVVRLALYLGFQGFHDMRERFRCPLHLPGSSIRPVL
jgi:hypothetical protein